MFSQSANIISTHSFSLSESVFVLFTGGQWKYPVSCLCQCSTAPQKHLWISPLGSFILFSFLPWPSGMGGALWSRQWTGVLLSPHHGADHLGQSVFRLSHRPWGACREALFPVTSSVSCLFSACFLPTCVDLRVGGAGGWDQWSPLLLQPNVWGDVLGASRAAEPISPSDGADECAQVSRGRAGKDSLAALLSLALSPVLAPPRGKL